MYTVKEAACVAIAVGCGLDIYCFCGVGCCCGGDGGCCTKICGCVFSSENCATAAVCASELGSILPTCLLKAFMNVDPTSAK